MHAVLFDIDGTLIRVHSASRDAVRDALSEAFDRPPSLEEVSFAGKTDPEILIDILKRNGHRLRPGDPRFDRALAGYERRFVHGLTENHVQVLPGVRTIPRALDERSDLVLGLVTGNLAGTASAKLETAGLADYFAFGAYGSDHVDRNELPALALRRAQRHAGRPVSPDRAIVVGDTPRDVQCGVRAGARTVAVCTGTVGREELEALDPDLLLEDLTRADPLIRLLEAPGR